MFGDYTTESMERGLIALQTCPPFDYERAYYLANAGDSAARYRCAAGRAGMLGQQLALDAWLNRMSETIALRSAA
jgi:hypothetical protein